MSKTREFLAKNKMTDILLECMDSYYGGNPNGEVPVREWVLRQIDIGHTKQYAYFLISNAEKLGIIKRKKIGKKNYFYIPDEGFLHGVDIIMEYFKKVESEEKEREKMSNRLTFVEK